MGTVNPRPRGGGSMQGRLREDRKDREQIRRLLSQPAKPRPAAPAGGGISGATRCNAVDFQQNASGSYKTLVGIDWAFSNLDGSTGPIVSSGPDANSVTVSAAGWYMATFNFNVSWSAVPSGLAANITWQGDDVDYPTNLGPLYAQMGSVFAQVRQSFSTRWVLLPAGGWFRASLGWDGSASVGSFHNFTLDIVKG